jgi:hypothetical protein
MDSRLWKDVKYWSFLFRIKITSFTLKHWNGILWSGELLVAAIAVILIYRFWSDSWNIINIALAVFFGLIELTSLIISITVLHYVRDLVSDYTQAGDALKKVIMNTKHTLFLLSENPAFLQVMDRKGLDLYFEQLRSRLRDGTLQRVVFAYVNRQKLIDEKMPKWAATTKQDVSKLVQELFNPLVFNLGGDLSYKDRIFFIPLKTSSLPFFIAVADEDRMAMFCRQKIEDIDIRRSLLRGFITADPFITRALMSVYLKTIELDSIAYKYECKKCQTEKLVFDHDLLQNALLTAKNAISIPDITCDVCNTEL